MGLSPLVIRYLQTNLHTPEEWHRGLVGDCWRTAICCIIERPPWHTSNLVDQVIHRPRDLWTTFYAHWLARLGWRAYSFGIDWEDVDYPRHAYDEDGCGYHLIIGRTVRGTSHVVVGLDGRIIWDPSPSQTGLVPPTDHATRWWFEKIVPL